MSLFAIGLVYHIDQWQKDTLLVYQTIAKFQKYRSIEMGKPLKLFDPQYRFRFKLNHDDNEDQETHQTKGFKK